MQPIRTFTSRYVVIPINDIDTDQLIPAKFLKVTDKAGLADGLFSAWRYNEDGSPKEDFVLNTPAAQGAQVLVAGDNFGCGSSREHAPWALVGYGFRAVVSTSFADIFKSNALKNGLLPIVVDSATHQQLLAGGGEVTVDLQACAITLPDGTSATFPIDAFARYCLLNGIDELGFIQNQEPLITAHEGRDRWEALCAQ